VDLSQVSPDYRKSLPVLQSEWQDCQSCELGVYRVAVGGAFVFGEGYTGGIMFIGPGPEKDDEIGGRPYVSRSGNILRHAIKKLGIDRYYITNVVSCRSCAQSYDNEGQPRYRRDWKTGVQQPVIVDQWPTPLQVAACIPRLYEEIYLVDPVLIVALGVTADALTKRKVSIQAESGTLTSINVPGAGKRPTLTEKKQIWARKVRGALIMPHVQNEVVYPMMPLLDPAFVSRKQRDERWKNPVQVFAEGMKKAAGIYDRYMFEVHGDRPSTARELNEDDIHEAMNDDG